MRALALAYVLFLLPVVVLADVGTLGPLVVAVHAIPWGDKVCHLVLATMLGFVAAAFPGAPRVRGIPSGTIFVFAVATIEECSQRFVPSRHFDLFDLAADAAGIAIGTALALRGRADPAHPRR